MAGFVPVIDISSNQGHLNASVTKAAGIVGVWCRAAHFPTRDPRFGEFVMQCVSVGLPVGAYMFFEPSKGTAAAHADLMLSICDGVPLTLPPQADVERPMTAAWLGEYFFRTETRLRRHVIYLNDSLGLNLSAFADRDLMCPDYVNAAQVAAADPPPSTWLSFATARKPAGPGIPIGWDTWDVWQWSADGNGQSARYGCTGGNTAVDLDIVKADAWARWVTGAPFPAPIDPEEFAMAVWS